MTHTRTIDVHQHLWPPELIDALRRRGTPPRLDGWTLHLLGEPPYDVDPADHDPDRRRAQDAGRIVLGLSSPLGIEDLPPEEAQPLLDAWHAGAGELRGFDAWAAVTRREPDLNGLRGRLAHGFVGVQVPATWLASPRDVDRLGDLFDLVQDADRPVFVHPGPVSPGGDGRPDWWAAVVDYPSQLHAAWWSWHAAGRARFPTVRLCFAAGAGLAPAHHERFRARAGRSLTVDPHTFVETSSYSRQGVDALTRAVGIDPIVVGSDRPYGVPHDTDLGKAARVAFTQTNPHRLLTGEGP